MGIPSSLNWAGVLAQVADLLSNPLVIAALCASLAIYYAPLIIAALMRTVNSGDGGNFTDNLIDEYHKRRDPEGYNGFWGYSEGED